MKKTKYHQDLRETSACTKNMMEEKRVYIIGMEKMLPRIILLLSSSEDGMHVGADIIGVVKTNSKVVHKDTNENTTKY